MLKSTFFRIVILGMIIQGTVYLTVSGIEKPVLSVTDRQPVPMDQVKPASGDVILENFDQYAGNEELARTWYHPGYHGGPMERTLETGFKNDGRYSMKCSYTNSAELTKFYSPVCRVSKWDASGCNAISFWYKPDGSGRVMTIQFNIATSDGRNIHDLWEFTYHPTKGDTTARVEILPFTSLNHNIKYADSPETDDYFRPGRLIEIALYIGGREDGPGKGAYYFDSFRAIRSGSAVSLHPDNPHYFIYKEKPVILITSGEHYGAVINPDFDFNLYLETLHKEGFNNTRIFMGDYCEGPNSFCIVKNSLEAAPGKALTPWSRSDKPGYILGGNKFDLDKWNPAYFERLHEFMKKAQELDIIVEADLFFVGMSWNLMPMNPANNVNSTSEIKASDYMTLTNGNILEYQKKYCIKLVTELNRYDNLILNLANEPWFFNQEKDGFSSPARDETKEWLKQVSDWIVNTESKLQKRHLISVDYTNEGRKLTTEELEKYWKNISVFNHHYDREAKSVMLNYEAVPRAFSFNETGLMPVYSDEYRIQGWRYLMNGGSLYNNLDFTFYPGHEDGSGKVEFSCDGYNGCGDIRTRKQISALASFFNSIDFIRMKPANDIFVVYWGDRDLYALASEGKQYAIYAVGGENSWYRINIPPGKYKVEWIDPSTGSVLLEKTYVHNSGDLRLDGPDYSKDIAIRINRIN